MYEVNIITCNYHELRYTFIHLLFVVKRLKHHRVIIKPTYLKKTLIGGGGGMTKHRYINR